MFFLLLLLSRSGLLLHERSTIDVERRTRDVIPIDDEGANTASNLLRSADTSQRYPRQDPFLHLVRHSFPHVRPDPARTDTIDRHVVASQLQGCGSGETDDAGFGCAIVGLAK